MSQGTVEWRTEDLEWRTEDHRYSWLKDYLERLKGKEARHEYYDAYSSL